MQPDIAAIAQLIGDPARARMLTALMGGRALTATELALEADITPQTASSHLARLVEGQLLRVRKQGRHKYFQLQGWQVAELLESLLTLSSTRTQIVTGPRDADLRFARVCYDHLAGELSVALYDSLVQRSLLDTSNGETRLTSTGREFFMQRLPALGSAASSRRPECRACLDWSERRDHLAGRVGQLILQHTISRGWAQQDLDSRALRFTRDGLARFKSEYGIKV